MLILLCDDRLSLQRDNVPSLILLLLFVIGVLLIVLSSRRSHRVTRHSQPSVALFPLGAWPSPNGHHKTRVIAGQKRT